MKKRVLLDVFVVLIMSFLLYYGASWQFTTLYSDAAKYQCYATAFWHGVSALKTIPMSDIQCDFITHPSSGISFITNDMLLHFMMRHNVPSWLIGFIAEQSPTQPLHALPHEYPLLTMVPFTFGFVTSVNGYQIAFAIAMILLTLGVYALLRVWKSQRAAIAFALYIVVCGWSTAAARFDILPSGFTLGALLLAERGRWRWAYALLAVATLLKLYPIILLPAFLLAQYKSRAEFWRTWWKGLDVFVLLCVVITLFSMILSVEGTLGPLGYFRDRPIQVESTAASLLWLGSFLGFSLHYAATFGSLNMLSSLSSIVSPMMTVLFIVGLLYVYWLQWRMKLPLADSLVLILLVAICTGKVFSPQYLLWVIPFVAYISEWDKRWLIGWTVIGLLTTWIFPYLYLSTTVFIDVATLPTFNPSVFIRNILLLTFLILLLYRYTARKNGVVSGDVSQHPQSESMISMAQAD